MHDTDPDAQRRCGLCHPEQQGTVVTAERGKLAGKRVIRGREREVQGILRLYDPWVIAR